MIDVHEIAAKSKLFDPQQIHSIEKVSGDASSKEFHRVRLNSDSSLILIKLSDSVGPLHTGLHLTQDKTFAEISTFLHGNNIPAPKLHWVDLELGYAIEEDLGNRMLATYLEGNATKLEQEQYFTAAIKLLNRIQKLPETRDCIIFKRRFTYEDYLAESLRFIEYYLQSWELSKAQLAELKAQIHVICMEVSEHQQVPTYRDYTPWNIMLDANDSIRVVDFQDCLLGSYAYDIVALLHDRDTDLALGEELVQTLLQKYLRETGQDESFVRDYHHCLLQRNLRLAGQFLHLSKLKGRSCYANWVPGCLYRLGRTIACYPEYSSMAEILHSDSDFQRGF